jgi:hypothetical protein
MNTIDFEFGITQRGFMFHLELLSGINIKFVINIPYFYIDFPILMDKSKKILPGIIPW